MKNKIHQLAYNLLQTTMLPNDIYLQCVKLALLSNPNEAETMLEASEQFAAAYKQVIAEWKAEDEKEEKRRMEKLENMPFRVFPMEVND